MKRLITISALFIALIASGQNFKTSFLQGFGGKNWDEGRCMTTDASGNIYIGGTFSDSVDFDPGPGTHYLYVSGYTPDAFILKLDRNGNFQWVKQISGSNSENISKIIVTSSNVYVAGSFYGSNVDFDPGAGTYYLSSNGSSDCFVLKLDLNGNFVFAKSFGSNSQDEITDFKVDSQGNIYMTGAFSNTCDFDPGPGVTNRTSNGYMDIFLLKLNANGNYVGVLTIGGSNTDEGTGLALSGNYVYITGYFAGGPIDFDPGNGTHNLTSVNNTKDIFLEKLDTNGGTFVWVKQMGGPGYEDVYGLEIDQQGNIYSYGSYNQTFDIDPGQGTHFLNPYGSAFLQKLNPSGNFEWVAEFGVDTSTTSPIKGGSASIQSITFDDDDNIYILGDFLDSVTDLDPGAGTVNFFNINPDNGYNQSADAFVVKLNSLGAFVSAKTFGGSWYDSPSSIALDDSANIVIAGSFESDTLYADVNTKTTYVTNHFNGGDDAFLLKYSQFEKLFTASATALTSPPFDVTFTVNVQDTTNMRWFWNFDDGSFSNVREPQHTYAYNGTYNVSLIMTDTMTGISDTSSLQITCSGGTPDPCNFQATLNQSGAAIICANDSFLLSVQPQSGATYSWFFNGITIPGAHSPTYYGQQQGFYMAVITKGGCSKTTNYFALANYPVSQPIISVSGTIAPCSNDSVLLSTPPNYLSYLWNTGDTLDSIYVSQSGRYTVTAKDANGCLNTSLEKVINASLASIPSICAVTTDGVNPHNVVTWKKENSQKIASYNVYRETHIAGVYQLLGSVNYSATPQFTDTSSNTAKRQYRYMLAAVDTCGKETPKSLQHTTMHLMINQAPNQHWNLIWRPYVGFNYSTYNIYRGTDSLNMSKIATISASNTSYTDLTNPSGNIYYQIEVVSSDTCNAKGGTPTSRSNIFNTKNASLLSIHNVAGNPYKVEIYPNPNKGRFNIVINNAQNKSFVLDIYDLVGNKVYAASLPAKTNSRYGISLPGLTAGVYFVRMMSGNKVVYRDKIVINR